MTTSSLSEEAGAAGASKGKVPWMEGGGGVFKDPMLPCIDQSMYIEVIMHGGRSRSVIWPT